MLVSASKGRDSRIKPGFCVTRFEVKLLDLTLSRNGPKTDILAQVALRNAELMLLSNWRSCACFKEGVLIEKNPAPTHVIRPMRCTLEAVQMFSEPVHCPAYSKAGNDHECRKRVLKRLGWIL